MCRFLLTMWITSGIYYDVPKHHQRNTVIYLLFECLIDKYLVNDGQSDMLHKFGLGKGLTVSRMNYILEHNTEFPLS